MADEEDLSADRVLDGTALAGVLLLPEPLDRALLGRRAHHRQRQQLPDLRNQVVRHVARRLDDQQFLGLPLLAPGDSDQITHK